MLATRTAAAAAACTLTVAPVAAALAGVPPPIAVDVVSAPTLLALPVLPVLPGRTPDKIVPVVSLGSTPRICLCIAAGLAYAAPEVLPSNTLALLKARVTWPEAGLLWLDARIGRDEAAGGVFVTCVHDPAAAQGNSAAFEAALLLRMRAALGILPDAPTADANDDAGRLLVPEVYLSLPCRLPLPDVSLASLAVGETSRPDFIGEHGAISAAGNAVQLLREHGLALLPNALDKTMLLELQGLVRAAIARTDAALEVRGLHDGTHVFAFREVASRGPHRYDLLLPADSPVLAALLAPGAAPWSETVDAVLGPDAVVEVSVVYSRPGAPNQGWHADGPHIGPVADWDARGAADAYALCAFVPLIDLNATVGFTQFWPGTHIYDGLIGFGQACPVIQGEVDGAVSAGSALLYDYRLIHRGMPNRSSDTERPVLQFFYHRPTYTEQRNYGRESLFTGGEVEQ